MVWSCFPLGLSYLFATLWFCWPVTDPTLVAVYSAISLSLAGYTVYRLVGFARATWDSVR